MNILHPRNWSRYSRGFSGDEEGLRKYKRIILLSQFTLFGAVIGMLHALEDLANGLLFRPMMDATVAVFVFICYLLNENGRHKLARISLLTFLNVFFFIYSSLADQRLGIYLYYFSWVGLAAVVFEIDENFYRFFFIGLSMVFTIVLFATNFHAFGPIVFAAADAESSFIINFVSSIVVLVFFILFMINMNEQSEKKLIALAQEVKDKNEGLEKANHELDSFFYTASHDLKVPLLDIKGAINAAMTDLKDERVMAYFGVLQERANKFDHLLQDIIDYSRNSQTGLRLETVDLVELVNDTIENFTFVKGADKIDFQKDIPHGQCVETDRVRLMIILNNIISNAIRYHRLMLKDPWIRITLLHNNGNLRISIADNGQGIDPDLLPKIFNMFFRGTNQSKGSGLGLYIVKETLEKMGGTIAVQSQVGIGTTFNIMLPVKLVKNPARQPAETIIV